MVEQNKKLKIRIAIVEDEEEDAKKLKEAILDTENDINFVSDIAVFNHSVPFIDKYKADYDIIFLDIELPDINGLDLAHKIRELDQSVIIIFVTNMSQFAVEGYKVDAMDFIIKPISVPNLRVKLERAYSKIIYNQKDKLIINDKVSTTVVPTSEIKYIEVINHKLIFHTIKGDFTSIGSLTKLEEKLMNLAFSRCNNCYLVNLKYVTRVEGFTLFIDDDTIQISRSKKRTFMKALADYLGGTLC